MATNPNDEKKGPAAPSNRLSGEVSDYLLQHSHNPVDWYPWGQEALERARREDRPLLVSIGYSACHWCHVMEKESFEDPQTAEMMNAHFINIKVDREERPDVDQIYMDAVVRLNDGRGGWPLTVFCTPEGRPFFGGTYYPPEPRHGMPSFQQILEAMKEAWSNRQSEIDEAAQKILEVIRTPTTKGPPTAIDMNTLVRASESLMQQADPVHGGFGQGQKFPTPTNLEFQLTMLDLLPKEQAGSIARHLMLTAEEMARRGLYDHLGGGFHRYCVDNHWTIPHFEKMLYDQGLLLRFYAEILRRGGAEEEFAWPLIETVDYLRREMKSPEGGFYASQDADAGGVEGAYQVWTPEEIETVLGAGAKAFSTAYGVDHQGNFENGTTHLIDHAREPRGNFQHEREALRVTRYGPKARGLVERIHGLGSGPHLRVLGRRQCA